MTIIKYTPEQHEVLDHMLMVDGILLVSAGAGTGKSFIAQQVAELLEPKRGLYTAFNKAIVTEGITRFRETNMECKTLHALAYKYVKPKQDIQDISYTCIKEKLKYSEKYKIIEAINRFYVSASEDMYEFMDGYFESASPKLQAIALSYIEKMIEGKLNPTFNFMLKYFHLMLVEGTVDCEYDLVILDEINDTTAVALEIFKHIKSPKKLGLGETNQAIYEFLNLVDGFEELKDVPIMKLTQSFRCSTRIASDIQAFMRKDVSKDFTFVGTDEPVMNGKTLYCTLTNAKIIQEISERLDHKKGFHLLRKLKEIFAYPMAIATAARGKEIYNKKYKFLEEEYTNYTETRQKGDTFLKHLLDHVDDQETKSAVGLMLSLHRKGINLFDLYNAAQASEVDLNYTIATVFTSKGLEFETVHIAPDLNNRITLIREKGGIKTRDDLVAYRCYYVATSRCGKYLHNAVVLRD